LPTDHAADAHTKPELGNSDNVNANAGLKVEWDNVEQDFVDGDDVVQCTCDDEKATVHGKLWAVSNKVTKSNFPT